jgi:RNA polymerase sigma-70 factor (ECF subfamily)
MCQSAGLDCEARIERLARSPSRFLAGIAWAEGLSGDVGLDATREAFIALLNVPGACTVADDPAQARALLGTLVRNAAHNLRRRHHHARPHEAGDAELAAEQPSAESLLHHAEESGQLAVCLRGLGPLRRSIVRMRMLEELSGAEVARALNLTPGHVAVLLHRAKAELRACLEASG